MFNKKIYLCLIGILLFTSPLFSNGLATDLFFSEYLEGSGNNKYIEIYNGTGASVDLSEYQVKLYSNGSTSAGQTLNLNGVLEHNSVYVIANASANSVILNKANITHGVTFYNGDDALELVKNSVVIDVFGVVGEDPGSAWTVNGQTNATQDNGLIRKSNVASGSTDFNATKDNEWDIVAPDYWDDLGIHTFDGVNQNDEDDDELPAPGTLVKLLESNFESGSDLSPWITISLASISNWERRTFSGNSYAYLNNFGSDEPANDWLISPAMDLRRYVDIHLTFLNTQRFTGADLKLYISDSYDGISNPEHTNWTELNFIKDNNTGSYNFISSGDVDLSEFNKKNVRIAYQYTSIGTGGGEASVFQIDDVLIEGTVIDYMEPVKFEIVTLTPSSPIRNLNFEFHVEALDVNNIPQPLANATNYTISISSGSGNLLGEVSGEWKNGKFEIKNILRYDTAETISITITDDNNQLISSTINNLIVQDGPADLIFTKLKTTGHKTVIHPEIIVEAKNDFGGTDINFDGVNINLEIFKDNLLVKTYTAQTINGFVTFGNVRFDDEGEYVLIADAGGLATKNSNVEIYDYPVFIDNIVPKYIIGRDPSGSIFGNKLITYALVELEGLIPNEEYRFINAMGDIDRSDDESGLQNPSIFTRGGQIYWHEEDDMSWFGSFNTFPTFNYNPNSCAANLPVRTEPYSTFRADENGNKKIWISIQAVNHSMFNNTTNRNLYWLFTLANEENNIIRRYQASQSSRPLHLNDNPSQPEIEATGIYDMNAGFEPGTYLVFYSDNEPAQPFASAIVQGDGLYLQRWNSFNSGNCQFETWFENESPEYFKMIDGYYQVDLSNGTSGPILMEFPEMQGSWGAYIPNMLGDVDKSNLSESSLNRIEQYDAQGNLIKSWYDEDGIWSGVNTNSVLGGKDNPISFATPNLELTSQKNITEFCNYVDGNEISWEYSGVQFINIYSESEGVRKLELENVPSNSNSNIPGFGSIKWFGERGLYSEKEVKIIIESAEHSEVFDESDIFTLYDAPDFNSESISAIKCEGENITFGVLATGSDVKYQWLKDGEILEGETNVGLQINNLKHHNSGVYNCLVYNEKSNVCGDFYSEDMVLYVSRKTEVTIQPESVGGFINGKAKFYFDIHGVGLPELRYNVTIQWFKADQPLVNNDRISGAKSNYLEIRNIQESDFSTEDDYYAVINGLCGEATTLKVRLSKVDIEFTKEPVSQDICENENVTFEIEINNQNNLELQYQWLRNGIKLVENQNYQGVNTPVLSIIDTKPTNDGEYECEIFVVNENITFISNSGLLKVISAPIITTDLPDLTEVNEGQRLALNVGSVSRNGEVNYQWYKDDILLAGEEDKDFIILNTALADAGEYYCQVFNDCGQLSSNTISVEVKEQSTELSVINSKNNGYELFSPNPNPANEKFNIEFNSTKNGKFSLKLIDMVGNEINLINNSLANKGLNSFEFSVNNFNLNSGVYLIVLEINNISLSQKLVINN